MPIRKLCVFIGIILSCTIGGKAMPTAGKPIKLKGDVTIYTSAKPGEPIFKAISALQKDLGKVLGGESVVKDLSDIKEPGIVIINSQKDNLVEHLSGYEAHRVYSGKINRQAHIILQGADMRGTIYSIYTFTERILGVPPLWFFASWQPSKRKSILIPDTLNIQYGSPYVKYRAWFPNNQDLLTPWRKLAKINNEIWLETALRLKINTLQGGGNNFSQKHGISSTMQLANELGMINTTSHPNPLNASFTEWENYWLKIKHSEPPALLLANEDKLEEFWRYNIETIKKRDIEMFWVLGFRGNGDRPFWTAFEDAPETELEKAEVINRMLRKQRDLLIEITGDPSVETTTIFYDEMSDLLAMGYIRPPADSNFVWTFVAARRDHYPNKDIQRLDPQKNLDLGYYLNMQFTSTGSHLVEGEGPWKMERNYRYVDNKSGHPLKFSVVNAGNIREFLLSLSANAKMMWDFDQYNTDTFLEEYCASYFGQDYATEIATLYHDYFYSYWLPEQPKLAGFDRQYIFQDLRYKRTIQTICNIFEKEYDPNPMKDFSSEREPGRTYRIVPEDNNATNQIDAIINGTTESSKRFLKVANASDRIYRKLKGDSKVFFNDNLRVPAYFMHYLNESLLNLCKAYQLPDTDTRKDDLLNKSIVAFENAKGSLKLKANGHFKEWYAGDKIFDMTQVYNMLNELQIKRGYK